jgi:hypothetical protein
MLETVAAFYKKIHTLSKEDISEYISLFGEKILDHADAQSPNNVNLIATNIPFSYPYIKKIMESKELTELYWNNDLFQKESIEDIEIAHCLLRNDSLVFKSLDRALKVRILSSTSLDEELVEKYFTILQTEDEESVLQSCENTTTKLATKYAHFLISQNKIEELIGREIFLDLIPRESIIDFLVNYFEQDKTKHLTLLKTNAEVVKVFNKLDAVTKIKFASNFLQGNLAIKEELDEDYGLTLMFHDQLPQEYFQDVIDELWENKYLRLMTILLDNNRKFLVPKDYGNFFKGGIYDLIKEESDYARVLTVLAVITNPKDFQKALGHVLKTCSKEIQESVVEQYKLFIIENEIYIRGIEKFKTFAAHKFAKEIDEDEDSDEILVKTSEEIASLSTYQKVNLLNSDSLSEELFDVCFSILEDHYVDYLLKAVGKFSANNQTKVFNKLGLKTKLSNLHFFTQLDESAVSEAIVHWFENESFFVKIDDELLNVLLKNKSLDELTLNEADKILKGYASQDSNPEIIEKLMEKISSNEGVFSYTLHSIRNSLFDANLMSGSMFLKALPLLLERQDDFTISSIIQSDKYFSFIPNEFKGKMAHSLSRIRDEIYADRIANILDNASDSLALSGFVAEKFFVIFYNTNRYFEGQEISSDRIDELNGDALKYALHYYKKEFTLEDLLSRRFSESKSDIEVLWDKISSLLESKEERLQENLSIFSGIFSTNDEVKKDMARSYILNDPQDDLLDVMISKKSLSVNFIKSLIRIANKSSNQINESVNKIVVFALKEELISLEEMVSLIDNEQMMDAIYQYVSRNGQIERKFIRYLRRENKIKYVPLDFLNNLDLLSTDKDWNFYNLKSVTDSVEKMNAQNRDLFFNNLMNSFSESASNLNIDFLTQYKFDLSVLKTLYYNLSSTDLKEFVSKGISEESLNKEMIVQLISSDLKRLNVLKSMDEDYAIELYNVGIKGIFSLKTSIELDGFNLVDILNTTLDPHLMQRYVDSWQIMSPYGKYSAEVIKQLVASVKEEDVTQERLSYEKGILKFTISDIELVRACYNKKSNKWSFVSGHRKDLYKKVVNSYREINSQYPEKVSGWVDLESGSFAPTDDISLNFKLGSDDVNKLTYMRELGATGSIKAVAKRSSDFSYKVDVLFEKDVSIGTKEIEKQIKSKTFDINKKLEELLKVSPRRTFGFELELGVRYNSKRDVASFLKKKGFSVNIIDSYKTSDGKKWDFKEDGSLNSDAVNSNEHYEDDDGNPVSEDAGSVFEIASPILKGKEGISESKKFLNHLFNQFETESGEYVNAGLHVHHDISDINKIAEDSEEILKLYLPFQETLYSLIQGWRSESEYCSKISPDNPRQGRGVNGGGGASGIIFTSYGTMEFRMKEGIDDTKEILNWIIYTQNIVDAIWFKLSNKIKTHKSKLETLSESTVFMLLENQGTKGNVKNKIKEIRKLVGLQEKFYA